MTWREMWTDELPEAWKKTVDSATSFATLRQSLAEDWSGIVPDVLAEIVDRTEADWPAFHKGLRHERRRQFAGEDWPYGHTLLPDVLLRLFEVMPPHVSMPTPVALDRLVQLKQLVERDGVYSLAEVR